MNRFCFLKLWSAQITAQASMINEAEFVVPEVLNGQTGSSAKGRRNYTNLQETSQWMGGTDVPSKVLDELLKGFLILLTSFLRLG